MGDCLLHICAIRTERILDFSFSKEHFLCKVCCELFYTETLRVVFLLWQQTVKNKFSDILPYRIPFPLAFSLPLAD